MDPKTGYLAAKEEKGTTCNDSVMLIILGKYEDY